MPRGRPAGAMAPDVTAWRGTVRDMAVHNHNNTGHLRGTLVGVPSIRDLRSGAHSVRLTIRTLIDDADVDRNADRREGQDVTVGIYVPSRGNVNQYRQVTPGTHIECDFWVESYTYQRDGGERTGQSLATDEIAFYTDGSYETRFTPGLERRGKAVPRDGETEAQMRQRLDSEDGDSFKSSPEYDMFVDSAAEASDAPVIVMIEGVEVGSRPAQNQPMSSLGSIARGLTDVVGRIKAEGEEAVDEAIRRLSDNGATAAGEAAEEGGAGVPAHAATSDGDDGADAADGGDADAPAPGGE